MLGLIVVQSGLISFRQPTPVNLVLADGGGGGTSTHVADTWQSWHVSLQNGLSVDRSSDVFRLYSQNLDLIGSSTPLFVELTVPIQFLIQLPKGSNLPGTTIPSWYLAFLVRERIDVSLNGQFVGSADASNYPDLILTYTSFDAPSKIVNFKFYILLSGGTPPWSAIPPLDLRQQISRLNPSQPFSLSVNVRETWDLAKYCNPGGRICEAVDHVDVGVQYGASFLITVSSLTAPISVTLPSQTVQGTCGPGTCTVTQILPSVSSVTSGQGWTATIVGNGTTIIRTETFNPPPQLPSFCSLLGLSWLCGTTLGVPNWVLVAVAVFVVLVLIFRPRGR